MNKVKKWGELIYNFEFIYKIIDFFFEIKFDIM